MARSRVDFNSNEFAAAVQRKADRMKVSAFEELEELGKRIVRQCEFETPVDTGEMRASWYSKVEMGAGGPQLTVGNTTDQAWYIEFGTAPHRITVKNAAVLADKYGNVFGKEVNHPGTPAMAVLRGALLELGYTLEGVRIHA